MEIENLIREIQRYATELRLSTIRSKCEEFAQKASVDTMTYLEFLLYILKEELNSRKSKRTVTCIKQAGLPKAVDLGSFELPEGYGLDERKFKILYELGWLRKHADVVLLGTNGTGKTTLAKGLLSRVIAEGMKGYYCRFDELKDILKKKATDPVAEKKYDYIIHKADLLVIDDVYACKLDMEVSMAFALMVDIIYEKASIIITSRRPVNEWKDVFYSDSITKSILERLIFHSETITLKAPSFRIVKRKGFFDLYDEEGNPIDGQS